MRRKQRHCPVPTFFYHQLLRHDLLWNNHSANYMSQFPFSSAGMSDAEIRTDKPGRPVEAGFMGVVLIAMFHLSSLGLRRRRPWYMCIGDILHRSQPVADAKSTPFAREPPMSK